MIFKNLVNLGEECECGMFVVYFQFYTTIKTRERTTYEFCATKSKATELEITFNNKNRTKKVVNCDITRKKRRKKELTQEILSKYGLGK
jgi:hypothetical protein